MKVKKVISCLLAAVCTFSALSSLFLPAPPVRAASSMAIKTIADGNLLSGWQLTSAACNPAGCPTSTEDTQVTRFGQSSMQINAPASDPTNPASGSYSKIYAVTPGENYTFSAYLREVGAALSAAGQVDSVGQFGLTTVLTPMKNGSNLENEKTVLAGGRDQTGQAITTFTEPGMNDFKKNVHHYTPPAGSDSVKIEIMFKQNRWSGGRLWVAYPEFKRKPKWQESDPATGRPWLGNYTRDNNQQPIPNPWSFMQSSVASKLTSPNDQKMKENIATYETMSDAQLQQLIRTDMQQLTNQFDTPKNEYHWGALEYIPGWMAKAYQNILIKEKTKALTQEEEEQKKIYARKAMIIMTETAKGHPYRMVKRSEFLASISLSIPNIAVYAYDILYNSDQWLQVQNDLYPGEDIRKLMEDWFRTSAMNLYNYYEPGFGKYDNRSPYGLNTAIGAAVALNDPDMIRLFIPWLDSYTSPSQLYADGFWEEATVSYHAMVLNLLNGVFELIQKYRDPAGYKDVKYGLKFNGAYDLRSRYPLYLYDKANKSKIEDLMKLPNGDPISLNDTWWNSEKANSSLRPDAVLGQDAILEKYLSNIQLYNYGFYSLVQGDKQDATFAGLTFAPYASGMPYSTSGHQHAAYLNLNLFGSGMEVLPDAGYPKFYERENMSASFNNMPWAWVNRSNNSKKSADPYYASLLSTRASLLAYDPGDRNAKAVQLVEASEAGTEYDGVDMKRRLLMMVNVFGNRSYTLDLTRLKGGDAHQTFLRAAEEEDTQLTASLPLTTQNDNNVDAYMNRINRTEGLNEVNGQVRKLMKSPQTMEGKQDFHFTWNGNISGTSLRAHMNGIQDNEVIFSRIPTLRRVNSKEADKDKYPGWHFQRRQLVTPDNTTHFGAVYETWRKDQQPLVSNVEWKQTADKDPMTQVAVVHMQDYTDIIYISNDTTVREFDGIRFSGRVAMLRKLKADGGRVTRGYIYGAGRIEAPGFTLDGKPDLAYTVTDTTSKYNGPIGFNKLAVPAASNSLVVNGSLPVDASLNGLWLQTFLGDKSGFGMKIEGMDIQNNRIEVHGYPPFEIVSGGAKGNFFPFVDKFIPGPVTLQIRQPSYRAEGHTLIKLNLDASQYSLAPGGSHQTIVEAVYTDATENVTAIADYNSSNPAVATISAGGLITANQAGSSVITVTYGNQEAKAEVVVSSPVIPKPDNPDTGKENPVIPKPDNPDTGKVNPVNPNPNNPGTGSTNPVNPNPDNSSTVNAGNRNSGNRNSDSIGSGTITGSNITNEQLKQLLEGSKDREAVRLQLNKDKDDNTSRIELPAGSGKLLEDAQKQLEVYNNAVTVTLPPVALREAAELALPAQQEDSRIVLMLNRKPLSELKDELRSSAAPSSAWEYNIQLSVRTAGAEKELSYVSKPLHIKLSYDAQAVNPDLLGVYRINKATGKWEYAGGKVNRNEQTITAEVEHNNSTSYAVLAYQKAYMDIPTGHWAYPAISILSAKHVLDGVDERRFGADLTVTRAQFTAMLVRTLGLTQKAQTTAQFDDVAESSWFSKSVAAAVNAGLVKGVDARRFDPEGKITREQMAVMLIRAYEWKKGAVKQNPVNTEILPFNDVVKISPWAMGEVRKAVDSGLMQGVQPQMFAPVSNASRPEAAQAIYNVLQQF